MQQSYRSPRINDLNHALPIPRADIPCATLPICSQNRQLGMIDRKISPAPQPQWTLAGKLSPGHRIVVPEKCARSQKNSSRNCNRLAESKKRNAMRLNPENAENSKMGI